MPTWFESVRRRPCGKLVSPLVCGTQNNIYPLVYGTQNNMMNRKVVCRSQTAVLGKSGL